MPGVLPHYKTGPRNLQVSTLVFGGMFVMPTTAASATDFSVAPLTTARCAQSLGVAGNDANVLATQTGAANTYGQPLIDVSVLPDYTSVYFGGVDIWAWYSGVVNWGDPVTVSATVPGVLITASGVTDPKLILGKCSQPGGVTAGMLNQFIAGGAYPTFTTAVYRLARVQVY